MPATNGNLQRTFQRRLARGTTRLRQVPGPLSAWIGQAGRCQLPVDWERSPFEALVHAVAHQQLHGRAAAAVLARLQAGFRGGDFPTPRQLQRAPTEKLRGMGFSAAKVETLKGLANATLAGDVPDRATADRLDDAELLARLTALRGIGQWTVEMLLIFTLGRLDVMPSGDFGVQHGLRLLLDLPDHPRPKLVLETATAWAPYRSVAAWYLWRRVDQVRAESPGAKK